MASAVMDTMSVDLRNGDVIFRANGSKIKFPGFMKVYVEGTDDNIEEKEDRHCLNLQKGDEVIAKKLNRNSILHSRLHDIQRRDL